MASHGNSSTNSDGLAVDVVIVGGGTAGTALAIALRKSGVEVALIEREPWFRDRVRGDALFPWGALEAARLGIADLLPRSGARPLPIWQTYQDRQPQEPYDWRADVPTGDVVWGVNHPGLQEALFQEAANLGAEVIRPAKALAPKRNRDGSFLLPVETPDSPRPICARLVVGADGRESGARHWIGAETIRDPVHHVIGGCLVAGIGLDADAAHEGRFAGGRSLVFRHANERARVYLVCQPDQRTAYRGRGAADRFLATCASTLPDGAFANARAVGPVAFFPGADILADRVAGEGIVLIGDAAGANDPGQGMGLSIAFRDARELSELLVSDAGDWQAAIDAFAQQRSSWYEPLRVFAMWDGPLITAVGPAADEARARAEMAAERDPWRGGYGAIHAFGPDGLVVSEAARRCYLGEDLNVSAAIAS
jgi:2-polyprenyl-6-methoxyphenol hydroxylase-like FAD-dependent oxidoreductase